MASAIDTVVAGLDALSKFTYGRHFNLLGSSGSGRSIDVYKFRKLGISLSLLVYQVSQKLLRVPDLKMQTLLYLRSKSAEMLYLNGKIVICAEDRV